MAESKDVCYSNVSKSDVTISKEGWFTDNFNTYFLDKYGVKHYQ